MHVPVLLQEVIDLLQPHPSGIYIDGTVGAGGHAAAILSRSEPEGQLYGLDQDWQTLDVARHNLAQFGGRVHLIHANFQRLSVMAQMYHIPPANGILLDLGVSSLQLDQAERGFSFKEDGPLDMRMNPGKGSSAADLANNLPEKELADLIYRYGEEPKSRRIARAIIKARPIHRTAHLADVVAGAARGPRGRRKRPKIHPATRTFQALRIAVNQELNALEQVLPQALSLLKPAGRLAVISFHSLEDRLVKQYFRQESQDCICPPEQLFCTCQHKAIINIINKKPIVPGLAEIELNPRARSAKLRVVELKEE